MFKKEGYMKRLFLCILLGVGFLHADEVVWSGSVHSDGMPTPPITLNLNENYLIKVSGFIKLGKFIQNREKLANDACYEFNAEGETERLISIKNSHDISVCDGKYHADHVYPSKPFVAKQNRIHFWVNDSDYDDNHGELKVEVVHIK